MGVKKRVNIADYIDTTPNTETATYALMGTGFKTLDENPSAQTKSKKYVCDSSATKSIASYDDSFPFEIDQIREQPAIEFICEIGEQRKTGSDAETTYVRVDLDKPVSATIENVEYEARLFHVAVEVASFTNDDGEMTGSGNLLGIGDLTKGKFNVETKKFTAEV